MKRICIIICAIMIFSCQSYSHKDIYVSDGEDVVQEKPSDDDAEATVSASDKIPVVELGLIKKEVQEETPAGTPIAQVMLANQESLQEPSSNAIQNSLVVYNYYPNYMYRVYTSPQRVTVVRMKKGEEIIGNLVSGDTANWIIAVSADKERSIIYIKPVREKISTNLVINTNQRSYYLVLKSLEETYMVSVEWQYPMDMIAEKKQKENALDIPVNIEKLYFGYEIIARKKNISWIPIKVFDDETKTFIQFKDKLNIPESPALFAIDKGKASLINYRVIDDYFVVDRVLYNAELRIGNKRRETIKIVRMKK